MFNASAPALAVLCACLFLAACGDDGNSSGGSDTGSKRSPIPHITTGSVEVDQVASAAVAGDEIELAGLTAYSRIKCTKAAPKGSGDPPQCRDTEDEGTAVEVLPLSTCDNNYVRPEQVPDAYRTALRGGNVKVSAVFRPKTAGLVFGSAFGATEAVVLETGKHSNGTATGVALYIKDSRVAWIRSDCAGLSELLSPDAVDSFIIEPKGIATTATGGTSQPAAR